MMKKTIILAMVLLMLITGIAAGEIPYGRRTTLHSRYDSDRQVTDTQISELLNAAFSMPTGGNQRALEFYIVTDGEILADMKGGNPYSQALDSAPCVIVIAADTESAFYDELLEMDAGIAAGGILLQAADMDLSSCVLSIAPQEERIQSVRSALNMGDNLRPILMIALGYPEADAVTGASVSNWDEGQVHWQR